LNVTFKIIEGIELI